MPRVAVTRDPAVEPHLKVGRVLELLGWEPPAGPERVLLKPNFLKERNLVRDSHREVITQREVIGPVVDWVCEWAGDAEISLADAPEGGSDMAALLSRSGALEALEEATGRTGREFRVEDLRLVRWDQRDGVPMERIELPGDSHGTTRVNLGRASCFQGHKDHSYRGLEEHHYYGADYDIGETNRHHRGETQEYMFSRSALEADVVINLPKMKTHKKAGVTLNLKNLVGLNGNKNWLPHHSIGTPRSGGDAYPSDSIARRFESAVLNRVKPLARRSRTLSRAMRFGRRAGATVLGDTQEVVRSGNWWGNDTIWRMILDLNRILLYARPDGSLAESPQRQLFSVVDGIVAGEGNGPEAPDPVEAGIVVAGDSFAAVDLVCTRLMGLDWERIPHLAHVFDDRPLPLAEFEYDDIEVVSDVPAWDRRLAEIDLDSCMSFRPHFGWIDHIEAR
jgi:uncharacterized protein (DUF362 family)